MLLNIVGIVGKSYDSMRDIAGGVEKNNERNMQTIMADNYNSISSCFICNIF